MLLSKVKRSLLSLLLLLLFVGTRVGAGGYLFSLKESTEEEDYSFSVALGDIDNDGDLDYITGNNHAANYIYLNKGKGNFTQFTASLECRDKTYGVALGHINGDKNLDYIAVSYDKPNRVYILYMSSSESRVIVLSTALP